MPRQMKYGRPSILQQALFQQKTKLKKTNNVDA
jgi:hypothetical protein